MNYGLILFNDGLFQLFETARQPGFQDSFSQEKNQPCTILIAPKDPVDAVLGLIRLGAFYVEIRRLQDPCQIRDAILKYFGRPIPKQEIEYEETEETEWIPRTEYEIR